MSRIGRLPITVPAGVTVKVDDANVVSVKGPKGELSEKIQPVITVNIDGNVVTLTRANDNKPVKALHGLSRALINNMVIGVSQGFEKKLTIIGVGYRAQKQGSTLVLNMGYSHLVEIPETADVKIDVPNANEIIVKGASKQKVGAMAAKIRSVREPEPYHGKGIRYADEYVAIKEGKAGAK